MKFEKSNLIHIQTNDNLIILTDKTNTLITLTPFLKKCEKSKGGLHIGTEGVPNTIGSDYGFEFKVKIKTCMLTNSEFNLCLIAYLVLYVYFRF